jgi:hypothetical protein
MQYMYMYMHIRTVPIILFNLYSNLQIHVSALACMHSTNQQQSHIKRAGIFKVCMYVHMYRKHVRICTVMRGSKIYPQQ